MRFAVRVQTRSAQGSDKLDSNLSNLKFEIDFFSHNLQTARGVNEEVPLSPIRR